MIHGGKITYSQLDQSGNFFFFLPFLSLERWTCQFLSIYRGKERAEHSLRSRKIFQGGRFLHSFSFSFVLTFSPLAVGRPGLRTQEENRSLFKSLLLVLSHSIRTTCSLTEFHFPQSPGRAEGGCQGQAKLLLPDQCRPLDSFSATVLHNK